MKSERTDCVGFAQTALWCICTALLLQISDYRSRHSSVIKRVDSAVSVGIDVRAARALQRRTADD
jgi:hypothetical protein